MKIQLRKQKLQQRLKQKSQAAKTHNNVGKQPQQEVLEVNKKRSNPFVKWVNYITKQLSN
jgi:hypothetical protein